MKQRTAALIIALLASAVNAQTFVQHIKCELETASGASLPPKTILQGTTPLWSLDQYRQGQAMAATTDGTIRAVVVLGQSATNGPWASITNYATSGYGYLVQFPTVGTNSGGSLAAPWWYTVLYQSQAGKTYWSGSGRLTIEPTQWSGEDGLGWGAATNNYAVLIAAEATTRSNADVAINLRIDALVVGPALSTQDVLSVISGVAPTSSVAYATSAGTATTAQGVAWSGVTGKPTIWPGTATDDVARASAAAAQATADSANSTGATHTAQMAILDTFRTGSTVNYSTNSGNAATVGGLTAEEIMRVGLRYYFTTNLISYGAVTGRSCSLVVPTNTQIAVYDGPVTNGQYIATYLMKSSDMPEVLLKGIYSFEFNGYHAGTAGQHPRIGADVYIVNASNGAVVQEFENTVGKEVPRSTEAIPSPFIIQVSVTNDLPKDGYAIMLKTKMIERDGYTGNLYSYFGRNYWSGFITPVLASQFPTRDEVDGMIDESTAVVQANLTTHTNRTDNPHDTTAAQAGALSTNGGTVTGSILTTVTTTPQDDELPTAGWVRGLLMAGAEWYYTTNQATGYGAKSANFVELSRNLSAIASSNVIASPVPSATYIAGGVITGTLQRLTSPITIDVWAQRIGGSGSSIIPLYAEVYYVYAGTTNHLGDWSVGPWNLPDSTPQNHRFVVSFNEPTITGAVKVIAYLKTGTVSGPAAGMRIYSGGGYSSHMDIEGTSGATAEQVDGRLTTHTNLTLATGAHGGLPTPAQIGAISNTEDGIMAANIMTNNYAAAAIFRSNVVVTASNGIGLVVVGTGRSGGTDEDGGAAIGIAYNTAGNKQLWFGPSTGGNGVRFVGDQIGMWNWTTMLPGTLVIGQNNDASCNLILYGRTITHGESVATNLFPGVVSMSSNLTVNGIITGNASTMTGCPSGAVATTDARYLATLTNIPTLAQVAPQSLGGSVGALIGDSITTNFGNGSCTIESAMLTPADALAGNTVVNYGNTGYRVDQEYSVWTNIPANVRSNYDWAVIMLGLNDVFQGVALGTSMTNYQALVNSVRSSIKSNGAVCVATMTPAGQWLFGVGGYQAITNWQNMNTCIQGGGQFPLTNVDYRIISHTKTLDRTSPQPGSVFGSGVLDAWADTGDSCHPNALGKAAIASAYRSALRDAGYLRCSAPDYQVSRDAAYTKQWLNVKEKTWLATQSGGVVIGSTNNSELMQQNYKLGVYSDRVLAQYMSYNPNSKGYMRSILASGDSSQCYQDFAVNTDYGVGRIGMCGPTFTPDGYKQPNGMYFENGAGGSINFSTYGDFSFGINASGDITNRRHAYIGGDAIVAGNVYGNSSTISGRMYIGPTIGGNTAYFQTDGTNLVFVNVGSVSKTLAP